MAHLLFDDETVIVYGWKMVDKLYNIRFISCYIASLGQCQSDHEMAVISAVVKAENVPELM